MSQSHTQQHFNQKLLTPMILGSILNPINSSIISVALIPIGLTFGASSSETAWLISALYLATSIGQPVMGKLIDTFGPRILFLIATSLVGIASIFAVFAPNLWCLVAARVLLGLGTCAGYPASMYLIRSEAARTGKESPSNVLTLLAISNQTIAVIGPTLGGVLLELGGWQTTFLINIPLSLACVLLGFFRFPKKTPVSNENTEEKFPVDIVGILLFAVSIIFGLLFLMNPSIHHLYFLCITGVSLVAFIITELKIDTPFINVTLLKENTPLLLTYARGLLSATITYCFMYGFTGWLEVGRKLSPSHAGLLLLPMFIISIIVSRTTGKSPKIRSKLIVGSIVQCVAIALLLFISAHSTIVFLVLISAMLGIPQGLLNLANQHAIYKQASADTIGASAGLLRTFMYMGAMLASSANGLFLNTQAITLGIHHIALFCSITGVVLIFITLSDRSLRSG